MKATAVSPANIAFIKYWGKKDEEERIPLNDSFSMTTDEAYTTTTVEFSPEYQTDIVEMAGADVTGQEIARTVGFLDYLRANGYSELKARVRTKNSFPKGAGAASSASGFAALAVAGNASLGMKLSEREMTVITRIGSGSACRSIPDGFVYWKTAERSDDSYAFSLYPHDYWDLRDILVFVDQSMKKIPTTDGMKDIRSSPFWKARIASVPERMERMLQAFKNREFLKFGEILEEECLNMHAVMMTQKPPLYYLNHSTFRIMERVRHLRESGIPAYYTMDAGPNVHIICTSEYESAITDAMKITAGVKQVIVNKPCRGARLIEEHLF